MLNGIYHIISLIAPFEWLQPLFMKKAFLAICMIAPLCGAMGVYVVNFKMAFFSDAISHSAFTGVALGLIFGLDPYITLIAFGITVGIGIIFIKTKSYLSVDTVIGVFFSLSVAFGITVISAKNALLRNLHGFLYGDILALSEKELIWICILFLLITCFLILSYNKLTLIGIDIDYAKTNGINVYIYEYLYAIGLALVVTVSIRSIGILLITALLIVPAAAARNICKSAIMVFWGSVLISLSSGILGLCASYFFDASTGATIVLFSGVFFFLTLIISHFIKDIV